MENLTLTPHGNNASIVIHILDDETMRSLGFTDAREGFWYFERMLTDDISFSLTVCKTDPSDWHIDVLDENFLQPYDYQYMLEQNPGFEYAKRIATKVETWMGFLADHGIITGHEYGDYI